jgi:hypothetical protein
MLTISQVLEYIYTGPTLLLYGAGLSNELGLPTWKGLVELVLKEISNIDKITQRKADIEKLTQSNNYPEVFDIIGDTIGLKRLYDLCAQFMEDPGGNGEAYNALAKLPFLGYLTTNYDDIFKRHLSGNRRAVTVHCNSKEDIEQIDFDAVPTLVKLHSDFFNPESMILTAKQYMDIQYDENYLHIREFLKSYVLTKRLLIVGYSVSDPDIQLILQEATKIFRRRVPIIAIVAGAKSKQIKEWEFKYNIRIFSYPNKDGKHSELPSILKLLSTYSGIERPRIGEAEIDLRSAQHLFMWHKLKFPNDVESKNGAIDSLLLGLLADVNDHQILIGEFVDAASKFFSATEDVKQLIDFSLKRLSQNDFVRLKEDTIKVLPAGLAEYKKNVGQFSRLCTVFEDQVRFDLKEEMPRLHEDYYKKIPKLALLALIDLFKERAIELFSSLFKERKAGINLSLGLFKLLTFHANEIDSFECRTWFVGHCTKILKNPKPHETELLSYVARAFYCFQALQLDSEAFNARIAELNQRVCLIDSNVLLPIILPGHPLNSQFNQTLNKVKSWGVSFYVLSDTIREAYKAIKWAIDMVNAHGERSKEILYAALGQADYRPNQVLDAFIQTTESKNISYGRYMFDLFGPTVDLKAIQTVIEDKLGVACTEKDELCNFKSMTDYCKIVRDEISKMANESFVYKSKNRIEIEANVYTIIAKWTEIKNATTKAERCCFLSLGGFLNHLSNTESVGINQTPIITIDGLNEMIRLVEKPEAAVTFAEWIKSSYFASSETLMSEKAARKVFADAINSAEDEYYANLDSFKELLDSTLSKNYIDEIPEIERPVFVDSLIVKRDEALKKKEVADSYYKEKFEAAEKEKAKLHKKIRYWRSQARSKE